jgi:hypothetical protein
MEKPADFAEIIAEARERCATQAVATNLEGRQLVGFCAQSIMKLFGDVWPQIAEWLIEESDSGPRSALEAALPKPDMERWTDALAAFAELIAEDVRHRRARRN